MPKIHESCFIASNAVIIGNVTIEKNCGIFFNAVIRGDDNTIQIGEGSNVQDCCVIHVDSDHKVKIGKNCLVGEYSLIMPGVVMEDNSILGAMSLLTKNKRVPKGAVYGGVPARRIK